MGHDLRIDFFRGLVLFCIFVDHLPNIGSSLDQGSRGEIASQMLARFERDVLPYHPQLVIWQTGTNQALRSGDIEGYVDTIREGLSRLKATRADVVLMEPQFGPARARTCSSWTPSVRWPTT
jgi:hypothetical protein